MHLCYSGVRVLFTLWRVCMFTLNMDSMCLEFYIVVVSRVLQGVVEI